MIQPVLKDTELIVDIVTAFRDRDQFHLWWLGQSGFLIGWNEQVLALDLYLSDSLTKKYAGTDKPHVRMTEAPLWPEALLFFGTKTITISHQHTDHMDPETLGRALREGPWIEVVAPAAWRDLAAERCGVPADKLKLCDDAQVVQTGAFSVLGVASAHDKLEKDQAGHNHFLGYVIRFGNWSIYHSGDTVVYPGLSDRLAQLSVDVAILPINGKLGNMNGIEAARLAKAIGAKIVIPCHYEMFEFNTASPAEFVAECERLGQNYKVLKCGERFTYGASHA